MVNLDALTMTSDAYDLLTGHVKIMQDTNGNTKRMDESSARDNMNMSWHDHIYGGILNIKYNQYS